MRTPLILALLILLVSGSVQGQEDSSSTSAGISFHPMLEAGVSTGGEITDGLFIYRNAKLAEISMNIRSGGKVYYGFGTGVELYRNDHFIPLFLQFKGMSKKKTSSSFISVQAGYAFTSSTSTYRLMSVKMKGGIFFSPGIGYKLKLDRHLVLLSLNYKHQFLQMEFEGSAETRYQHEANLHLLSFKAGFVID